MWDSFSHKRWPPSRGQVPVTVEAASTSVFMEVLITATVTVVAVIAMPRKQRRLHAPQRFA
ncbi:hypothetical protein [Cryobacterium sp. Y50]|uniref:hypothetical protein n=1 Tax=Cryobacterium sp. Y50 TaxID=2048286 RepID=UPI0011AFFACE|nr:hypothetical protein [Cryobacterium sp. Y50]